MKGLQGTGYEQFIQDASRRRLLEQESLILEATELLSTLMDNEKLSRADLARRLGRSKAYVTQVLRGSANVTLRTLADLGTALGYRFCFQANNTRTGRWVTTSDVPHIYLTSKGNKWTCWSGAAKSPKPATTSEDFEESNVEISELSA